MTTDLRTCIVVLPIVLVAWLALLAGVMRLSDQAPAALVILPPASFMAHLPPDVAITAQGPFSMTLQSTNPNLTAILYAAGASIVLPAGLTGCLPQS